MAGDSEAKRRQKAAADLKMNFAVVMAIGMSVVAWQALAPSPWSKMVARFSLGLFMAMAGVMHFVKPAMFVAITPRVLPFPLALCYISGVAEIAFGAMLMLPGDRMQNLGAWGLVALLFAVWPANIYCVFDAKARNAVGMTPALALIRVPLQGVFFAWAYQLTTTSFRAAAASAGINM